MFCDDFGSISMFGFSGFLMNVIHEDEDENVRKMMKVEIEKDQRVHFL